MKFTCYSFVVLMAVYSVSCNPRYLAIPLDEVNIIEISPLLPAMHRVPRHTEAYIPVAVSTMQSEPVEEAVPRVARASSGHLFDYVDFGGHTGENGAFGWYADYPAQS